MTKQMNDKIFIDTNVLVYCYTSSEPIKQQLAITVAESPAAYVSTQVLQELANVLNKRFGKSWDEIEGVLEEVCQNFEVVTNQADTVQHAVRIARRYHFAFYDFFKFVIKILYKRFQI